MNSPTSSRKAGPSRRPTHTPTPSTPPRPIPITPDHPNPSRKGSAALSTTDRRARRAQLRDFYGLPGDTPLSVSSSPKGGRKKIDKAEDKEGQNQGKFNATIYYENLISRADLAELMGTASKLNNEIAGLHSSRHSLVYNHHHQLFAAGDTIAVLNSRTPQLLSIVTNLQDSFSSISQLVDSIALPEIPQEPIDPVKAGIRRIRLMVIAEESPDDIRKCYTAFEDRLGKDVQSGRPGSHEELEECQKILSGLPPLKTVELADQ